MDDDLADSDEDEYDVLFSPGRDGEQDDVKSMTSAKAIQYKYRTMNNKRRGDLSSPSSTRKGTKFAFLVKENCRKYQLLLRCAQVVVVVVDSRLYCDYVDW